MKLPSQKYPDYQLQLFEKPLKSKGEKRWACGDFFEQAISEVSGGVRLKTDSTCDICPDIKFDDKTYGESKGVGKNSSVIFYRHRVEKDQEFMEDSGCEIVYWFWKHDCSVLKPETYEILYSKLAESTKYLLVVDSALLLRGTELRESRVVNSGYTNDGREIGYGKNGTGDGWTIRLSFFMENCQRLSCDIAPTAYGCRFPKIPVFVSDPSLAKLVFPPRVQQTLAFGPS